MLAVGTPSDKSGYMFLIQPSPSTREVLLSLHAASKFTYLEFVTNEHVMIQISDDVSTVGTVLCADGTIVD